jgi:hypothetical protein
MKTQWYLGPSSSAGYSPTSKFLLCLGFIHIVRIGQFLCLLFKVRGCFSGEKMKAKMWQNNKPKMQKYQGKFTMNKKNTARNILEKELSFQA